MSLDQFHATVATRLDVCLAGYVTEGKLTKLWAEIIADDVQTVLRPILDPMVTVLADNPDLNDCWADEDADGNQTRCGFTDLPAAEWCWPCRANAALNTAWGDS